MYNVIKNIIVFSIPINFVWEFAQIPLYSNMSWNLNTYMFCLVASVSDAVMTLAIFFVVAFLVNDVNWIVNLKFKEILFSLIIGFILSVLVEQSALSINNRSYSNLMPTIPLFGAGISPILQMLLLPLFVFYLSQIKLKTIINQINNS